MAPNTKGLFHVAVALAAFAEYFTARTRARKFMLGVCTGYHIQAAYGHFVAEPAVVAEPKAPTVKTLRDLGISAYPLDANTNEEFLEALARLRKQYTY